MLGALSSPRHRRVTLILLALCGVAAAGAAVVGIADNPPGILLAFVAAASSMLAFVHPWRTVGPFARLLLASVIGFVVLAVLHNVLEGVSGRLGGAGPLPGILEGIGVLAFLLAVLVCPPVILLSAIGSIVLLIRNRRRPVEREPMT